mgnify:CR=1 FL=1
MSFAKAVTEDIMVEPGKGSIDFTAMHKALDECGYDGWCVVEQDLFPVKSFDVPLEKATIGRENCARQASNEIVITYPFYNRIYTIPVSLFVIRSS